MIRQPPPTAEDLDVLSDLPDAVERVRLAEEIAEWDTGQSGYVDIEPELSNLKEFEHGWKLASGMLWRQSQSIGNFCDAFENHDHENEPEPVPVAVEALQPSFEEVKESLLTRKMRKGKIEAVDVHAPPVIPVTMPISSAITQLSSHRIERKEPQRRDEEEATTRQAESKRRKQLWRGLIGKDPGFGQSWKSLSRVCHSHARKMTLRRTDRSPAPYLFESRSVA